MIGPFHTQIPGVYGPTKIEFYKTDKGYAVGFLPRNMWGEPFIDGSPRDIAKDIILKLQRGSVLEFPFYGTIFIKLKPEVTCTLNNEFNKPLIDEKVDINLFLLELTQALKSLSVLIPFI